MGKAKEARGALEVGVDIAGWLMLQKGGSGGNGMCNVLFSFSAAFFCPSNSSSKIASASPKRPIVK